MKILIPIPRADFDPTEVAVPWHVLTQAGHEVVFATPDGGQGQADALMLTGEGLDVWGWIPGLKKLKLFGLLLRASRRARTCYQALRQDPGFQAPVAYDALVASDFDGLILPGGHAPQMRVFLESEALQGVVAAFFAPDETGHHRPVGAICHGVVLAARSLSPQTGRSVLYGRKTTALTWALEKSAWDLTRFWARFWDPSYYRTYMEEKGEPAGHRGVEAEVRRALANEGDFVDVPKGIKHHWRKTSGLFRDGPDDPTPAWVVRDGNYISARWPGDAYTFARTFLDLLEEARGA